MNEPRQIEAGQQPFTTTDGELALSLITAGCQFAAVEEGGPAQQHWTPDTCRNRWITVRQLDGQKTRISLLKQITETHRGDDPVDFERAVMRAEKLRVPGIVTYYFLRDAVWQEAMEAHDKMVKEAQDAALQNRPMVFPEMTAAQIMAVCYARRCNEKDFPGYAWVRPVNLALGDVRKTVTPKEGVPGEVLEQMSYRAAGGGKIWSINLSDEKRATPQKDGKPFLHPRPKL